MKRISLFILVLLVSCTDTKGEFYNVDLDTESDTEININEEQERQARDLDGQTFFYRISSSDYLSIHTHSNIFS